MNAMDESVLMPDPVTDVRPAPHQTAETAVQAPKRTPLSGGHLHQLQAALLDGFTRSELSQLLRFEFGVRLDKIVATHERNDSDVTYDVVLWALEQDNVGLPKLLAAAQRARPDSAELQTLVNDWQGRVFGPPDCPYPGMRPFKTEEKSCFYGRDPEIDQAVDHLHHRNFLVVIGASGSGKSSLVAAGIVPALQKSPYFNDKPWAVYSMRPGPDPFARLAAALGGLPPTPPAEDSSAAFASESENAHTGAAQPAQFQSPESTHLLLVVDQYEELFTSAAADQRAQFEESLLQLLALPGCYVILALRADFYANLIDAKGLPDISSHQLPVPPLRDAALKEAIAFPARDVGVELKPELVERLLADAGEEPGVLPFIQETLVMLWAHAERLEIGLAAYTSLVGGKSGRSGLQVALAKHAEDVYQNELNDAESAIARRILLRLIQFSEGRADTRRQQTAEQLRQGMGADSNFDHVLAVLTDNRLLTLSDQARRVDLSHEALISGWPRLHQWIGERRAAELTRRRLEEKAAERQRLRRSDPAGGLLDDVELKEANGWIDGPDAGELGVSDELRVLVTDSRSAIDAAALEKRRAAERLRRRNQGLAVALAATVLLLAVAVVLFFNARAAEATAQANADEAATQAAIAQANAQEAGNQRATAVANANLAAAQAELARAEALAKGMAQAQTARQLFQSQINESRLLSNLALQQITRDPVAGIQLSLRALPSATVDRPVIAEAQSALISALRAGLERSYRALLPPGSPLLLTPHHLAFGQSQIGVVADKLYLVNYNLGEPAAVSLPPDNFDALAWGEGGRLLAVGDKTASIWQNGQLQGTYSTINPAAPDAPGESIDCAVWRPGSNQIALCRNQQPLLWRPGAGAPKPVGDKLPSEIRAAAWSPDGARLAVWDKGAPKQEAGDAAGGVSSMAGQQQGALRVWDMRTNAELLDAATEQPIFRADWSQDGHILVTTTNSNTATIWNFGSGLITTTIAVCPGIGGVRFLDNDSFFIWSTRSTGQIWSVDGRLLQPAGPDSGCLLSDDGIADLLLVKGELAESESEHEYFVKVYNGGAVELWSPGMAGAVSFKGHEKNVLAADLHNGRLATAGQDGTIRVWDVGSKQELSVLHGHTDADGDTRADVVAVKWLDNQRLLSAGEDGTLRIWQVFDGSGEPLCSETDENGLPICVDADSTLRQIGDGTPLKLVRSATWINDEEIGVFGSGESSVALRWNVATGEVRTVPVPDDVTAAFWLPNAILLSTPEGNVRLLDPATGKETPLPGYTAQVTVARLHPNGLLATGDNAGTIRIWDTAGNTLLAELNNSQSAIHTLHWSADGKRVLSADSNVVLWDVDRRAPIWSWPPAPAGDSPLQTKKIFAALNGDGSLIAVAYDRTALVLDAATQQECWRSEDLYEQPIRGLQWAARGEWPHQPQTAEAPSGCGAAADELLLIWNAGGTLDAWDWGAGAVVMHLSERARGLSSFESVAVSPNGAYLLTAAQVYRFGSYGVVRRWRLWPQDPQALLDEAARADHITRPLSAAQLAAFSLQQ